MLIMKKIFISVLIVLVSINFIFSQIPNGYYDNAQGKTGVALKQALHDIIKNHTVVSYGSLHSYYQQTDKKSNGKVWDMYSDIPGGIAPYEFNFGTTCGNYNGEGDCYNREHSWPQSWFNSDPPMVSDMFHVYPTDGYVNGKRSNYPYGEVTNPTWTSQNGSKLGPNSFPGYSGTVFEPIDSFKGDFARTYFYMSVRYYTEDAGWQSNAEVTKSEINTWALKMLYEWNLEDTVSKMETDRNNAVYGIQHNRNPFIDNPEFAHKIWGSILAVESLDSKFTVNLYPNPAHNNLNISFNSIKNSSKTNLSIANNIGQTVYKNTIQKGENNIDISELIPGIYIVIVSIDNNNSYNKLIVF